MDYLLIIKVLARAAEHGRMGRGIGLVSLVGSLVVAAMLFSSQLSTGGPTAREGSGVRDAQIVAATFAARQADSLLGAFHETSGTYAGADVSSIAGVRLVQADAASYCLAIAGQGVTLYARGPGGDVGTKPC